MKLNTAALPQNPITETALELPWETSRYRGKVRDVYDVRGELLVFVASDRISAFDVILPRAIPYKGQVLNQTAAYFLEAAKQICPVHLLCTPDPNVSIGLRCEAYPVEFVVRGYLCGHALRTYQAGGRELCGVPLPEGLRPNDPLPEPILTPTTKSKIGHDIDISEFEILKSGLIPAEEYYQIKHFALALYDQGRRMAAEQGLILADTKYEFGNRDFDIILIDEIHTPDSSRYLLADGYEARQAAGEAQPQLSKEFVREWLLAQGFNGQDDAVAPPVMPDSFVAEVSERYIDVFEQVTGQTFTPRDYTDWQAPMQERVIKALRELGL